MGADNENKEGGAWPLPKFRFEVDLGPDLKGIVFREVSGLDIENQIIEYRHDNSPVFSTQKMPGIVKYGNVTLKKGVFVKDNTFWTWHQQVSMNAVELHTMTIRLLDENDQVTMQWTLSNAWPTKINSTDLDTDGDEITVDSIEIAHEQMIISAG